MDVTHVHPEYPTEQAQSAALSDVYAACLAKLAALRAANEERSA